MSNPISLTRFQEILTAFDLVIPSLAAIDRDFDGPRYTLWSLSHGMITLHGLGDSGAGHLVTAEDLGLPKPISTSQVITGTGLFANADRIAEEAVRSAAIALGTRLMSNVDTSHYAYRDLALRTGAIFLGKDMGLPGKDTPAIVGHIASLYSAASAPVFDRIRSEMDPAFCRAADTLARCPLNEVNHGVITYYMGLDVDVEGRAEAAERRLRAASAFPSLAGYFAMVPSIADAIDAGEKLFRIVEEASGGAITKPIMSRLGQAADSRARLAVAAGMLTGLPPDQYPRNDSHWKAALDLWEASCAVADAIHRPVLDVWRPERITPSKGDWEGLTRSIVSKGTDTRPPFGLGLTKDDAAEIAGLLKVKPFTPNSDIYETITACRQTAWRQLAVISERDNRAAHVDFNEMKFAEWVLRLGYREVNPESLQASLRGVSEASALFGQRVALPTVLVASQITGLPIVRGTIDAATSAGFDILTDGMTFTNMANFARSFTARTPFLTAPIVSARDRGAEAALENEAPRERLVIDDRKWREVFRITEDKADWPVLTPIIEFLPGIVFVPVENMQQAREEGSLTPGKLDRNGVPELNHCLGVVHSPKALAEQGPYQLFSIREVRDGTYTRLASGTFRMEYRAETGGLTISRPLAYHFNGPDNSVPPPAAQEVFERFREFVASTPQALNQQVVAAVRDERTPGVTRPVRPDITLPKLLGYNPFQSFKIETAWETWRDQGLISSDWINMPLAERANAPQLQILHEANRQLLERLGVRGIVQPRTRQVRPIPAVKPGNGMAGIFI